MVMRMSVTLDKELLEEAQHLVKKKTKREVIEEALRELIKNRKRQDAIQYAGKVEMDITLRQLLKMRREG
jgi:metal-responsive CopG/Arc/MetJ family transcriptional regulator